ncbi:tetratricopeptide repeat protein [Oribacterium sp. FC2011]|uniref:tetratricopeptide repeat protein n=1 Tax=Oribacterium sp. FC2011 TaxID=1408311 RepID=UPI0006793DDF|nr:tetratricopeptide repeat protein [Oribacterium sp. FC2011]
MEKKSNPIIIIFVVTGILLAALVGMLVYFNLPAQRIRRMLKSANKYIAEENYDEAILTLKKMIEIDSKNEDLYVLLANTYEKNGDIDKEIEFLQEAVTLMPEKQKISEVLLDVYPEVTLSESSGTYTDPVSLSMSSSEGGEIFYKISGSDNESKYSSPVNLGKNGKYSIEYYAVSKNGYEGEHKTATYVINLDKSKYHFNEWVDEFDGRHYYDENGLSVTGWLKLKEKWYLFDGNGVMLTGFRDDKGNTYYLTTDGIMVIGWQDINGKRYYFNENGEMLKNQWIDDTFYVGADGAMLVDTKTPDGKKVGKDGRKKDEAWKQAYILKIKDVEASNPDPDCTPSYQIGYVDEDDIPELIYRCICFQGESGVMTYYEGKTSNIFDRGSDFSVVSAGYMSRSGTVRLNAYANGWSKDGLYRLKYGKFTEEHTIFEEHSHLGEVFTINLDDNSATGYNDDETSWEAYNNIAAQIKSIYDESLEATDEYNAEEAIRIIENW